MKKILSLIALSSLLVLFWCTSTKTDTPLADTQETAEIQTYENKTNNFSVKYPGTREFQEDVYGSDVMFFTPLKENDKLRENIGIMKKDLDKSYSLDEYYALTKPELENMIPDFVEVSKENITVNGIDAQKLIYQGTQWEFTLKWEQIYLIKDNAVYITTYTATQETFWEFIEEVDAMVSTLEVK